MKFVPKLTLLSLVAAALAAPALAATPAAQPVTVKQVSLPAPTKPASATTDTQVANKPAAIVMAENNGLKAVRSFPAGGGLTGWVMNSGGSDYTIVFTTGDGQYLLSGALLDKAGKNLTAEYNDKYSPKPDYTAAYNDVAKNARWIATGADKPKIVMYAFADLNCHFCNLLWKASKLYASEGLQIRWVPVSILAPSSETKAAAVLQNAAPSQAWADMEDGKTVAGVTESADVRKALQTNLDLMQKYGFAGTPGILWTDAHGAVLGRKGMMLVHEIAAELGVTPLAVTDAELARYK